MKENEMETLKEEQKETPKYNTAQNITWMIRLAWKTRKRVLLFVLLTAALEVCCNLTQLYIAPRVLTLVEQKASLESLLLTIAFFTAALFAITFCKEYLGENEMFPRVDVRQEILGMLIGKCSNTSYPNILKPDFIRMRDKAHLCCSSNSSAAEKTWHTLTQLLKNIGGFVIYLTILSNIDPLLLTVTILTCIAGFLVSRYTNNWVYEHRDEEEDYYTRKLYVRQTAESITMAKDIRIFGLQNWMSDTFDAIHNAYLAYRLRVEKVRLLAGCTEALLTMARNGIAYWYLIRMALQESLAVGEFLLYFTAVSTFTTWVMGILQESLELHKESLDLSLFREFLEYPEPFRFEGGIAVPEAKAYELRMEKVSFRYPEAEEDTLREWDLTIQPGEKVAIVGLNGAGKSTVVKLLCGLLDPTEGRILLNGIDIREFNRNEYYERFSTVFQDFSILDVTVAENIAQSASDIDQERIKTCVEQAGLTQMVEELPMGLQTHVGREVFLDGVLFSGGQTQKLMLARALYKAAPILILDEPTAALDPIAENQIYLKYHEMTEGKTALFISHRLASTRFCDRILLIADGKIAEEGDHESLLTLGGVYAGLFEVQSRYYQEGREF